MIFLQYLTSDHLIRRKMHVRSQFRLNNHVLHSQNEEDILSLLGLLA